MIRYCDDFVVVSNAGIAEVTATKREIKNFLETELHLELSEEKTTITHVNDGFDFLGFHIQRVESGGKWAVHLRPSVKAKERIKKQIKALTSRNRVWLDEYTNLINLNVITKGWANYYRHTSLLKDIEEITRYTWHRHLSWLLDKHKGSRKRQLIESRTKVIHGRTRWTAQISEGDKTIFAYQWLPTRRELKRSKYHQKGRDGFSHPYLPGGECADSEYPSGTAGPDKKFYTFRLGVPRTYGTRNEPLEMNERRLRAKIRDDFRCTRCGRTNELQVHHTKGMKSHQVDDLETMCGNCHREGHGYCQRN